MIVPLCILVDAYRDQRSCSHGSECCVVVGAGVSVGGVVGEVSRCTWKIGCTRVGPHGSGIVMCDWCVVRRSFPGRERLYTKASIMV